MSFLPPPYSSLLLDVNLWDHQREGKQKYALTPRWLHQWEPRTGKTRLTLASMVEWFRLGYTRVLVSAPPTVCADVWMTEITKSFPVVLGKSSVKVVPLYFGTIANRKKLIIAETANPNPTPTIMVVNQETLAALTPQFLDWGVECLVLDELHYYKTPSSLRHLAAYKIAKKATFVRGLTGTLVTRHYGDVYGQCKIIDSRVFGTRQEDFNNEYLIFDQKYGNKLLGYRNIPVLREKLLTICDIKLREECFDIPAEQEVVREIDLPKKIKDLYKRLVREHVLETNGKLLSVDHALARLTMLQQLAGGSLPNGDGTSEWVHDALLDSAEQEVNEVLDSGHKIVVFYRFDAEGAKLAERLKCDRLSGHTPVSQRSHIIKNFQDPQNEQSRVLVVQEAIGSVGLSFAITPYIMFYSMSSNYGMHKQARDRIFSPAVTEDAKLTFTYLQARGTVHKWIYSLAKAKQNASDVLLRGTSFERAAYGG